MDVKNAHGDHDEEEDEIDLDLEAMVTIKAGCCSFNPVSGAGRKWHQIQMFLLPFIPIAILVMQNCYSVFQIVIFQKNVKELQTQVDSATEMGTLLTALQQERAEVAFFIFSNGSRSRSVLEETFGRTDHAVEDVHNWPEFMNKEAAQLLGSKLMFQIRIEDLRKTVEDKNEETVKLRINYYSRISSFIMDSIIRTIKDTGLSSIWKLMIALKDMIRAVEYFGITIVDGLTYFGEGSLTIATHVNFITYDALAWKTLNQTKDFVTLIKNKIDNMTTQIGNMQNVMKWRKIITKNVEQEIDLIEADFYFTGMIQFTDELRQLQDLLYDLILEYMETELRTANFKAMLSIILLTMVLFLSPVIIFLIRNASITIQTCAAGLTAKSEEMKREKQRCDRLISQMLPPFVANQLKKGQLVPAETFAMVTVYFSDVVGFSELVSESAPLQVVGLLNSLYNLFDSKLEKFDVYKVETIGDTYMVVSGAPQPIGKRHVTEIAHMATDLLESVSQFVIPHRPDKQLLLRVGFNSGSIVAGVVGMNMPRYCIFGDTVNVASRMESTGEAMKIHISQSSKDLLDDIGGYEFEFRGYQDVKGKGKIPTFWLTSCPKTRKKTD